MILEVCIDSVASAINAEAGGADRLELCGDLITGGVTPSLALFERVRKNVSLPIHVLLRPRFGDFLYNEEELKILIKEARQFYEAGADALVIGCLTKDGHLDMDANAQIMDASGGLPVNLHRAFDMCCNLDKALEDAKKLGVTSILTSGGYGSALEGLKVLNHLKMISGNVEIMAGAGINADAIQKIRSNSCITAFHMSGKKVLQSKMEYRNPHVFMGLPSLSEYEIWETDTEAVRAAKKVLF